MIIPLPIIPINAKQPLPCIVCKEIPIVALVSGQTYYGYKCKCGQGVSYPLTYERDKAVHEWNRWVELEQARSVIPYTVTDMENITAKAKTDFKA